MTSSLVGILCILDGKKYGILNEILKFRSIASVGLQMFLIPLLFTERIDRPVTRRISVYIILSIDEKVALSIRYLLNDFCVH